MGHKMRWGDWIPSELTEKALLFGCPSEGDWYFVVIFRSLWPEFENQSSGKTMNGSSIISLGSENILFGGLRVWRE